MHGSVVRIRSGFVTSDEKAFLSCSPKSSVQSSVHGAEQGDSLNPLANGSSLTHRAIFVLTFRLRPTTLRVLAPEMAIIRTKIFSIIVMTICTGVLLAKYLYKIHFAKNSIYKYD